MEHKRITKVSNFWNTNMPPEVAEKLGLFHDNEALAQAFRTFDAFYEQYVLAELEGYGKLWLFGTVMDNEGKKALVTVHHRITGENNAKSQLFIAGTNGEKTMCRQWEVEQVREERYPLMHPRSQQYIRVLRCNDELASLITWPDGWGLRTPEFTGACETLITNEMPRMACEPAVLVKYRSDQGYYL